MEKRTSFIETLPIEWSCPCGSNALNEGREGTLHTRVVGKTPDGSLLFGHHDKTDIDLRSPAQYTCAACGAIVTGDSGAPVSSREEMKKLV